MRVAPFQLREALRRAIFYGVGRSEAEYDPAVVAWAAYTSIQEGGATPGMLRTVLNREKARWSMGSTQGRELGAVAALALMEKGRETVGPKAIDLLTRGLQNARLGTKLAAIRLPDQMFLIALAMKEAEIATRASVVALIKDQLGGPTHRQVLLHAALQELGETPGAPFLDGEDLGDAIASLWWKIRYTDGSGVPLRWEQLDRLLSQTGLTDGDLSGETGARSLAPWEKSLLYECLCREFASINPAVLFELYPLNARVKKLAGPHFARRDYPTAVLQAMQGLNELIQTRTGDTTLSERKLVTYWFDGKPPRMAFNDDYSDRVGHDDHEGVSLLLHGAFQSLRNPPSHRPGDEASLTRTAIEAMNQLVLISYLMDRVDRARRLNKF